MEFLGRDYPEPKLSFNVDGTSIECSPENTTLFIYRKLGDAAIKRFSHLFYSDEEADLQLRGWIGDKSQEEIDQITASMLANSYLVVQSDEVAECDVKAYDKQVVEPMLDDLQDYHFPEDWK